MMQKIVYIVGVLAWAASVQADVIVNEVMANEPGGVRSLEWIELYNDSETPAFLSFVELFVYSGTDSTSFLLGGSMGSESYLVLCRDSVKFEEYWGDSSGVWGDHALEGYAIRELSFQLANPDGRAVLYSLSNLISELAWDQSGEDGHSWERFHPASDVIEQSLDPSGSTPGRINSVTPMPIDLALAGVEAVSVSDSALLVFEIVNRGLTSVSTAFLDLFHFDENAADSLGLLVTSEPIGQVDSGFSVLLVGQYQFPGYYQPLVARLRVNNDDRPSNNRFAFTAPGYEYPPVILSEFLANPTSSWVSEWVELENVSDTTIDLAGWLLGDSISLVSISAGELQIQPTEYLVLAQDTAGFRLDYPLFAGRIHQPSAWCELNNGSDSVRLVDHFGIQAGCFYYDHAFDDNHSWSRSTSGEYAGRWGRSEDQGGTPGEENRVRFEPEGTRTLGIKITPQIVSPDGDGRDDSTVIVVNVSGASTYSLKLYDSHGRLVKTFEDHAPDLAEQYVWRGRDGGGQRLPIGIYILYFEATGVESVKKTIVLAR